MTEQPSSPVSGIADSTIVTFPAGATSGTSRVLASGPWGLIVRETPFHPLNPRWPDQPADTGTVEIAGRTASVVDCLVGSVELGTGRLIIGADVPVPHGAEGWHWVVVHVLDEDLSAVVGTEATLRVDSRRRHDLSIAHTARHLSGLALNATLASLWSKGVPADSLGNPNFDALALSSSAITTNGFRDTYRIRTWSPHGGDFDAEGLEALVKGLGLAITDRIQRWLLTPAPIRVTAAGPSLADPRSWECDLPQATARVACGGTHPVDLGAIADIDVTATLSGGHTELALSGAVIGRSPGASPRTRASRAARYVHTGLRAIRH
jgi:alanyl-tRNA synthetase